MDSELSKQRCKQHPQQSSTSQVVAVTAGPPDIFKYSDYRLFLNDALKNLGRRGPRFSLRNISRRMGMSSPATLSMICAHKRHLAPEKLPDLAAIIGLDQRQQEYFELIFLLSRCKATEDREKISEKLKVCFASGLFREMVEQGNVYARFWYLPILREMVTIKGFHCDQAEHAKIAETLDLSTEEVRDGFATLVEIGMLKQDENGKLSRSEPSVHNFGKTNAFILLNYNIKILEQSIKASVMANQRRYFESLTLAIPNELMPELKTRVNRFFKEIDMLAESCGKRDQVVQVNTQLFTVFGGQDDF